MGKKHRAETSRRNGRRFLDQRRQRHIPADEIPEPFNTASGRMHAAKEIVGARNDVSALRISHLTQQWIGQRLIGADKKAFSSAERIEHPTFYGSSSRKRSTDMILPTGGDGNPLRHP